MPTRMLIAQLVCDHVWLPLPLVDHLFLILRRIEIAQFLIIRQYVNFPYFSVLLSRNAVWMVFLIGF